MAKLKWILAGLIIGLAVFGSTGWAFSWGSGRVVSESRIVPPFQSIDLAGSGEVYLTQGTKQTLDVRTDDNLMRWLETKVVNGTLKIRFRNGVAYYSRCRIDITLPHLQNINVSGSGTVQGRNKFHSGDTVINISGSGNVALDLEANQIAVNISGSGNATLGGKADHLNIEMSGSGTLTAFDSVSRRADVSISGSGKSEINVTQVLNAQISGSGRIDYRGNPVVNAHTSGSGSIHSVD